MALPAPKEHIIQVLTHGALDLEGQFVAGSNSTFLGKITHKNETYPVVYKPVRGENPLWDFPTATLARREVAAYLVSEALGWELVPPSIFRKKKLPFGAGSLQYFVEHDPEYHYFSFSARDRERLRNAAAFDLLINNADRKGGHILVDDDGHIWLIDHGVCFHTDDKLRTVIWDFAGQPLPDDLRTDIVNLVPKLLEDGGLTTALGELLSRGEIAALGWRAHRLVKEAVFPAPDERRRSYPWPPV
ncbi:MAG: SCO1664 family protein [Anaerolineae bacterium]|nr:SCO1664 family protein [Anaerolineae bacterium]